jgi:hypothetical protein
MGLDMFLFKRLKDKCGDKNKIEILRTLDENNLTEIAYWRKANQIHGWFINNVKDGELYDNNEYLPVSEEELKLLLTTIKVTLRSSVLHHYSLAEERIPPMQGFFFGYYWKELKDTEMTIERILKDTDFDNEEVVYYASW